MKNSHKGFGSESGPPKLSGDHTEITVTEDSVNKGNVHELLCVFVKFDDTEVKENVCDSSNKNKLNMTQGNIQKFG